MHIQNTQNRSSWLPHQNCYSTAGSQTSQIFTKAAISEERKRQQRVIGLLAYYAQWISQYSDKSKPLITNNGFPS